MPNKRLAILIGLAGFLSAPALSQVNIGESAYSPSHGANLFEVFLTLVLVVGLIFIIAWCFKRVGYHQFSQHSLLKVKACLPLSTKEKVFLIEVGEEQILIGVSPGYIGKIKTLKKPLDQPEGGAKADFSNTLQTLLNGKPFQKSKQLENNE